MKTYIWNSVLLEVRNISKITLWEILMYAVTIQMSQFHNILWLIIWTPQKVDFLGRRMVLYPMHLVGSLVNILYRKSSRREGICWSQSTVLRTTILWPLSVQRTVTSALIHRAWTALLSSLNKQPWGHWNPSRSGHDPARPEVSKPWPAKLHYVDHSHICKLYIYTIKITQ
jgi:hypothetical protein